MVYVIAAEIAVIYLEVRRKEIAVDFGQKQIKSLNLIQINALSVALV
jgi:hypothetical protein